MSHRTGEHLPPFTVRPRFKVSIDSSIAEFSEKINHGLDQVDAPCKGRVNKEQMTLYPHPEKQHYWSPQLKLSIEEIENGTILRGLYGPRPAVWTLFVFIYSFLGFAAFIIGIVGLSNASLGKSASILWLFPVLIIIVASLYLVGFFGRKLGLNEMVMLHQFLLDSTGVDSNKELDIEID